MASARSLVLIPLAAAFLFLAEAAAPSPSPAAVPLNLTAILLRGGQFTYLARLLQQSRIDEQLNRQLNDSYSGLTVFAPTDGAFADLKAGTLNDLSQEEQIQLVLSHVLPRYYSLATFATASNPLSTQGSGAAGAFTLNVTASPANPQAINVSTGVDSSPIGSPIYSEFPLVVYPVNAVLLPYELFGPKPPAGAPEPAKSGAKKPGSSSPPPGSTGDAGVAQPPKSGDGGGGGTEPSAAASALWRGGGWRFIAGVGALSAVAGSML